MNERNVAALRAALVAATSDEMGPVFLPVFYDKWARDFAAQGVLAPAALTDEEGYDVGSQVDFTTMRSAEREAIEARKVRAELERIAKAPRSAAEGQR